MELLLAALLLIVVVILVRRMRGERAFLRAVASSIRSRALHLEEDAEAMASSGSWRELVTAVNALVEENRSLSTARDGQLVQLRALLDTLSEAVLVTDASALVLLANGTARRLLGSDEEIAGRRLPRLLPTSDVVALVEDLRRGDQPAPREIPMTVSGKMLKLALVGRRLPAIAKDPGSPWALFTLTDVTRERELEGVQKELIGNVSHELRTPISVIRGYAETLVDEHERMPREDRERFIGAIHRHSVRLANIVEDLLTLGRLESKYPGFEYTLADMHEEIRSLASDFEARARASGHRLELALDAVEPVVRIDSFRISQVLENLVGNAMKYSGAAAVVRIRTRNEPGLLLVAVEDNGPGIPAADQPRIFERFYRVEKARSRDKGGTGLGLTIVREIVELHGGKVWVESEEGKGSAFWFRLPLPRTPEHR